MIDFDGGKNYVKNLIRERMAPTPNWLREILRYKIESGVSPEAAVAEVVDYHWGFELYGLQRRSYAEWATKFLTREKALEGSFGNVKLYEAEVKHLRGISDIVVRKLLYLCLIVLKWNNHPSGWTRYDRDFLFSFWGIDYSEKEKRKLIAACQKEGLELRVVGSKNPVVCFNVNFRAAMGQPVYGIPDESAIKSVFLEISAVNDTGEDE